VARLVDQHLLVVLVHGRDPNGALHHDVCVLGRIADLVDPLPWGEALELDLGGEDGGLFVIEQRKERDVSEFRRVARHRSPRLIFR
jgi:hypothetical protein